MYTFGCSDNQVKMSLKRKLTQTDLRKAMSEHKKKLGTIKKIDSPLAKYPFHILYKIGNVFFNPQSHYHIIFDHNLESIKNQWFLYHILLFDIYFMNNYFYYFIIIL